MIQGIGIDIIELERIRKIIQKNPRFLQRILSECEQEMYEQMDSDRRKIEFVAGRFAAKEAFGKATGNGIGELRFTQIEILKNKLGAPFLVVPEFEARQMFVSISHSKDYAVAQVIIMTEKS